MVKRAWTDQRIEDILGNLLRAGVGLSAFVVFCGAVVYLTHHGLSREDYRVFQGEPSDLRSVPGIVRDALALERPRHHPTGPVVPDRHSGGAGSIFDLGICRGARPHVCGLHRDRARHPSLQPGRIITNVGVAFFAAFASPLRPLRLRKLTLPGQAKP